MILDVCRDGRPENIFRQNNYFFEQFLKNLEPFRDDFRSKKMNLLPVFEGLTSKIILIFLRNHLLASFSVFGATLNMSATMRAASERWEPPTLHFLFFENDLNLCQFFF